MKRRMAAILAAAGLMFGLAGIAEATPGPGASNQCAPGQHGNTEPAFKPGSCR